LSKIVLDTSVIINGQIIKQVESKTISNTEIIIPAAVLDELQSKASQKKEQGFAGLNELKKLQSISKQHGNIIKFEGTRPSLDDVKLSGHGRIDAIIKDIAKQSNSTLYTSDHVQALVAEAEGVEVCYLKPEIVKGELEFLRFFDTQTMSVHLKEGLKPMAKKGKPGSFKLEEIEDKTLTRDYLEKISEQILDIAKTHNRSNLEISKTGAIVIQHEDYRIAITYQPFSEGYEITIVHPIVRLSLEEYKLSEKLKSRFAERAEGIIISGSPGSGKSTLASSLADFYQKAGKIVKTFESPRDLQVDPAITQYTRLEGSFENSADILLLVRPDYTIFDEVRRREDFQTFSELRLAGVGMVGVIHANSAIDSIQRFIGKIELGIIPSVIDTVVFVSEGKISKVYELELKVKVPSGMTEQDLARPIIEIRDFEDNTLEYEIYTFGEENVIIPVSKKSTKLGIEKLAEDKVRDTFRRFDPRAEVEILSGNSVKVMISKQFIPSVIGRGGSTISELEKMLKLHIDVVPQDSPKSSEGSPSDDFELPFDFSESKTSLLFNVGKENAGNSGDIYLNNEYLVSSRITRKGQIKIPKHSNPGKQLMRNASSRDSIQIFIKD
jgi:ATPase